MRKFLAALSAAVALFLASPMVSSAQAPDGVIELSGGSVAAGIGYSWGSGTLIFQGQRYPLKVSGLSLASVGITQYTAAGSVEGLKSPQSINGVFTSVAAGATLGGGGNIAAMRKPEWRGDPSDVHHGRAEPLAGGRGCGDIAGELTLHR